MTATPCTSLIALQGLRRHLAAERAAIVDELAMGDRLSPGLLSLLSGLHAAIAAVDAQPLDHAEPLAARLRVRDVEGEALALIAYAQDGAALAVEVAPLRALALAAELTEAVRRRMAGAVAS